MNNVLLVVDTQNLNFCMNKTYAKDGGQAKLDYAKYVEAAVNNDHLYRAVAFGSDSNPEIYKFRGFLKGLGFETKFSQPIPGREGQPNKYIKPNVNIALTVMQLISTGKIDKVIIGSNDIDLIELVLAVKAAGIICEIYACCVPTALRKVVDNYTEIAKELIYESPSINTDI